MSEQLHLYTNEHDTVIATDLEDAVVVLEEHSGAPIVSRGETMLIEQVPDDELVEIWCNAAGNPDVVEAPGNILVSKLAYEWAERGRGYLSCVEQ